MVDSTYTHISVIADRSGSMFSIADDMNGGLRTFLKEQNELDGKLTVDVTTFDRFVETLVADASVSEVPHTVIHPRGSTALNDAIGSTVTELGTRLATMPEEERPATVIVVVITDGMENSSVKYTTEDVRKLVTRQQDEWNWNFVFLGANIDSFNVGGSYGMRKGGTLNYVPNTEGVNDMLRSVGAYVSSTRAGVETTISDVANKQEHPGGV